MFENISLLRTAGLMARHATARQKLISSNIANSDTPKYTPRDLVDFSKTLSQQMPASENRKIRIGHFDLSFQRGETRAEVKKMFEVKPNGNSVSLEGEMLKSIEVERQHSKALAIYQHSIDLLKMSIGRGR